MTSDCRVLAVATAAPRHTVTQSEVRAFAGRLFARDFGDVDRLLAAFDNTGIERRQFACPLAWYEAPRGFAEKNRVYCDVALELATNAAEAALARAELPRSEIGAVVFVSTTGVRTPSLDGALLQRLDLPRSTARVPIWGLGCAGGVAGLARAADLVRGTGRPVLLVAVELCSTTFVHGDRSKSNLIATALFGDGAAAVVLGKCDRGPALLAARSELLDDTEDVMGWSLEDDGLRVRFAKHIPAIVRDVVPAFVRGLAEAHGRDRAALRHFVVHPGGAKVLQAYERALDLAEYDLEASRAVLARYGNMSSVTVLFVLEQFLASVAPTGALGVLLGLGPGFSAEGVLMRW